MARRDVTYKKTSNPDVFLDLCLEDGLLVFLLTNRADAPARNITTTFSRSVLGLDGHADLAKLALFDKLPYLAPLKTIRIPIDRAEVFYRNNRATTLTVTVRYTDHTGAHYEARIRHNPGAYRNFPDISNDRS